MFFHMGINCTNIDEVEVLWNAAGDVAENVSAHKEGGVSKL